MPKHRRDRSVSLDRMRSSTFSYHSLHPKKLKRNPLENLEDTKKWEEARCFVCMEHPHNAVLLVCSCHDKGCHPYLCDTSYRHSNCFDQFRKSSEEALSSSLQQDELPLVISHLPSSSIISSEATDTEAAMNENESTLIQRGSFEDQLKPKLVCPLCRGQINGWIVVESARSFMNAKSRSCACETCDFSGTYAELRNHARQVHPLARPTDADPERQHNWRMMEQQSDLGDLLSTLQSSVREERSDDNTLPIDEGSLLSVFYLVRMLLPVSPSRSISRSVASRTRAQVALRRRQPSRLGRETYNLDSYSRDDDNDASDGGSRPLESHLYRSSTREQ